MVKFEFVTGTAKDLVLGPAPQAMANDTQPGNLIIEDTGHYGSIYFQCTGYEGVSIWCWDYNIQQTTTLLCSSQLFFLDLHFMVSNSACFKIKGIGDLNFLENQYNILYGSSLDLECTFQKGLYRILSINVNTNYLKKWVEDVPLLREFLQKIADNVSGALFNPHSTATPEMVAICNSILHCRFYGDIRKLYLEAKTLELLTLCLSRGVNTAAQDSSGLKPYDIQKMHAAREYLLEHMDDPCSIIELARKVGTNDFKLKKGFKQLYGVTIFDFLMEARMERAKILLLETDTPVRQIALMTGYKSVSSFTAAFKGKVGYPPAFLRKHG
jgi:AraC-like DNA-binding protein